MGGVGGGENTRIVLNLLSSYRKMGNYSEELNEDCDDRCIEDWVGFILEGILILIISIFGIIGKDKEKISLVISLTFSLFRKYNLSVCI